MEYSVDVYKVLQTIDEILKDIRENYDPTQLTQEELKQANESFDEIMRLALIAKFNVRFVHLKNSFSLETIQQKIHTLSSSELHKIVSTHKTITEKDFKNLMTDHSKFFTQNSKLN